VSSLPIPRTPRILGFCYLASCLAIAWGCDSLKEAPQDGAATGDAGAGANGGDGGASGQPDPSGGPGSGGTSSEGGPGTGGDAAVDSGEVVDPATVGAGPLGALPTGYCCSSDDDCRNRHCENVGGAKMCLDFCLDDDACTGITTGFHCALNTEGYGFCQPTSTAPTCVAKATYRHGLKPLGSCCQPLGDGRQGSECLSGVCDRNGADNPYLCTTDCGKATCPATFTCGHADDFGLRFECLPVGVSYSCTP